MGKETSTKEVALELNHHRKSDFYRLNISRKIFHIEWTSWENPWRCLGHIVFNEVLSKLLIDFSTVYMNDGLEVNKI